MDIKILIADYLNSQHAKDISYLLNCYAKDPMGGGQELPLDIQDSLALRLSEIPHSFSVICYVDDNPAGLITCFENFSTFKCKPLINIHDIVVEERFRKLGISQKMLSAVEKEAQKRQCCKITLEVLEGNNTAQHAYKKFGFGGYELDPKMGKALFWEKEL